MDGSYQRKVLALDRLSAQDFERLTYWLVRRQGYERIEYLGEVDPQLVRELLEGVRKLRAGTPIRVAVEKWWRSIGE